MKQSNWNRAFEATPENFERRIESVLSALPEQEERTMKNKKMIRKAVLLAAAVVMVLGGSVFADEIMGYMRSDPKNTYTLADVAAVEEALGTVEGISQDAKFLESYSNGFTFAGAIVDGQEAMDKDDLTVYRYQGIQTTYTRDGARVDVEIMPDMGWEPSEKSVEVACGDVTVYTLVQDYKVVNETYEKTEEDLEAEEAGELLFSYDDSLEEPVLFQHRFVCWRENGMYYCITNIDSQVELEELVEMAQELITSK